MLSYSKSLLLKESGYPQDNGFDNWLLPDEDGIKADWYAHGLEGVVKCPDLSELIEACGKDFESLTQWIRNDGIIEWEAKSFHFYRDFSLKNLSPSPEEAVANLYLAICNSMNTKGK